MRKEATIKKLVIAALLAAVASGPTAFAKDINLGLAIPYFGQEYWATLQKGAEDEAAKTGVKLVVAESYNDPTKQTAQVESFIASKVDAILLPPANPQALIPAVEEANKAGIPVITVDTNVAGGKVASFVASNNITVGKIAGKQVAKLPPDTTAQAEAVFTAYQDINAMFGISDVQTLPFWKVAKERGINDKVFFVGVDATKEGLAAVAENSGYAATVAQQPAKMGALAVDTALKVINGEKVPEYTEVPVSLVTIDKVRQFMK